MNKHRLISILRWLLIALCTVLIVGSLGLFGWATLNAQPATERALKEIANHNVQKNNGWYRFQPDDQTPTTALIYYPGGLVEPDAYAVTGQAISEAGYLVIIPDMPLNLAIFAMNQADEIIAAHPEIEKWVIGGHSLGGSMAAEYAKNHLETIDGLILFASYPASSTDFSTTNLPILSLYGSEDLGLDGIEASFEQLPSSTVFKVLEGGNHAQFGDYGEQEGDGVATISLESQQREIVEETVNFLANLP